MSERVLHENDKRIIHEWSGVGSKSPHSWMNREFRFVLLHNESGWPVAFFEYDNRLKRASIDVVSDELARLAARVAELEGENAKLYSGILDLYNAHQNEKVNAEMRASGRWTQIKGLVGEANDRELRAARAEVDNG